MAVSKHRTLIILLAGLVVAAGVIWVAPSGSSHTWETARVARFVAMGKMLNPAAEEATYQVMRCVYDKAIVAFGPAAVENHINLVTKYYANNTLTEDDHRHILLFRPLFTQCSKETVRDITGLPTPGLSTLPGRLPGRAADNTGR